MDAKDAKSLSPEELTEVKSAAVAAAAEAEAYLAAHPELQAVVSAFTSAALAAKPADVIAFAKAYFEKQAAAQAQVSGAEHRK